MIVGGEGRGAGGAIFPHDLKRPELQREQEYHFHSLFERLRDTVKIFLFISDILSQEHWASG